MNSKTKVEQNALDLEYLISLIKKSWLIFLISAFTCFGIAVIYNKLKLPVYEVGTSLLIKPNNSQAAQASSQFFQGFGLLTGDNNFQNKIQVLNSSPLIRKAISNLGFQISYFNRSNFNSQELYKNSPFIVVLNQNHPQPINVRFRVEIIDSLTFRIKAKSDDVQLFSNTSGNVIQTLSKFKTSFIGNFGQENNSENYSFKLVLNENFNSGEFNTNKFAFTINDINKLIKSYQSQITVEPTNIEASVANLKLKTTVPVKAVDLLTSLTNVYLASDVDEKIHASVKTIEYIDNQLGVISDSLQNAENNLQRFRSSNKVIDISVKSGRVYDQLQEFEREKANTTVRYKYYQYINEYFENNKEISDLIAPSSMGIEDPLLNNLIQELTTLNAERVSLIENNQAKSPYLKQINIKIDNLKNTIAENIKYIISATEITLQDLDTRLNGLNSELGKLPSTERQLLGYERQFNLNDAIYTFLLERRAEAQIAKASYLPGAEVIEPADIIGNKPIAPKKRLIYILGIFAGVILPFLFLRIRDILQNKITETTDVTRLVDVPVLGQIYQNNKKVELVVNNFPKSHIAESFRIVRTGLNYFLNGSTNSVIVITSTFGQEGKSFISNNLSSSLASTDKRTILLGFDLRKPKVYERLDIKNDTGISTFLSNQASIEDVLQKTNVKNLDVITSGPIPPNPSELIASSKTKELFALLRSKYDYIIVDTPPVGILSDTYVLMDQADLNIYVIRQNQTPRREFQAIISNLKEKKIKNLCVVINDIQLVKKSKYGYDYYDK